jgi:hypothetical protein
MSIDDEIAAASPCSCVGQAIGWLDWNAEKLEIERMAKQLARKVREDAQVDLFDCGPKWRDHWWGMPDFTMGDARPRYKITVNFYSPEDVVEFGKRLGLRLGVETDSLTFPPEDVDKPSDWEYCDEA